MKYKAMAAFAAASVVVSMQPGITGHPHKGNIHATISHHSDMILADYLAECCNNGKKNTASAQTLNVPGEGVVVRLTANKGSFFAETGVEFLNQQVPPVTLAGQQIIQFNIYGPTDQFVVYVDFTSNNGSGDRALTVANGGIEVNGHKAVIRTGTANNRIPAGATITGLFFDLEQDCNKKAGSETVDINGVFIGSRLVNMDLGVLQEESAFCSGGGC